MNETATPAPASFPQQLPPWAKELIRVAGAALLAWLAARYGITLPSPAPAQPAPQPTVLVLNAGTPTVGVAKTP